MSEAAAPSPLCGPLRCPLPSRCGPPPLLQNCDQSAPASHSMLKNFNDFINITTGFVSPIENVMPGLNFFVTAIERKTDLSVFFFCSDTCLKDFRPNFIVTEKVCKKDLCFF